MRQIIEIIPPTRLKSPKSSSPSVFKSMRVVYKAKPIVMRSEERRVGKEC